MKELMEELKNSKLGAPITHIMIFAFLCGDVILLAPSRNDLKNLASICKEHGITKNYKFNPQKCLLTLHDLAN